MEKKILYLHGFASSGASGAVEILRREFFGDGESNRVMVIAPDIAVDPAESLPMIKDIAQKERPTLVVGKVGG